MVATYTVKRRKAETASVTLQRQSGQSRKVEDSSEEWHVYVEGVAPDEVDLLVAGSQPGLPVVGVSVKTSPNGQIYPYLLCVKKSVTRDENNARFIRVNIDYDEDELGGGTSTDPNVDPDTIPPSILAKTIVNRSTAWDDIDGQAYIMKNGLPYAVPGVRETGGLQYEYTRYDSTMTNGTMRTRRCAVNSAPVRIGNVLHAARTLKITDVLVDFGVQWDRNPGGAPNIVTTNRVKYVITENNPEVKRLKDDGTTETIYPGWDEMRIESSSQALKVANDFTERAPIVAKYLQGFGTWYLKSNGTPHPPSVQGGTPPQTRYKFQQELDFNSFL